MKTCTVPVLYKFLLEIFDITERGMAAKLAYKLFEPPGGGDSILSPIIFLHGSTCTKEDWNDIPQVIADGTGRKVYNVDARNHGESEYTKEFSFDLNVGDLFHFMNTINAPKAVLIGHSMGGITAIKAALQKPERIDMIFIEDMYPKKLSKNILDSINEVIRLWTLSVESTPKGLDPIDAVAHAKDYYCRNLLKYNHNSFFNEEDVRKWSIKLKTSSKGDYALMFNKTALTEAFKNPDTLMTENSGQYNGQAFFIYGSRSQFEVYKEDDHIKKCFPKAELIKFEGATHSVHLEFPLKFAEAVLQRLQ